METLTVIKVGGAVVEDPRQLAGLLARFAGINGRKALVHGGGRRATKVAAALGIESRMVGGRRITDKAMLEVVTMVYGGLVNKNIVAQLAALGIKAIGLTGADMGIITADRRPPMTITTDGGQTETIDFGCVGDVKAVDGEALFRLIEKGITPVIAPLSCNGQGQLLNTNADTIAAEVAVALGGFFDTTLVFAFEKDGVLDKDGTVIPVITRENYNRFLAHGTISGGMLPKIDNALAAIARGVKEVRITGVENLSKGTAIR